MSNRYYRLLVKIQDEIPGVKIIHHRDSILMRIIHFLLKLLTFGNFQSSRYTTTIGKRMYVPNDWLERSDSQKYITLRHEVVHMRQFRQWPFKSLDRNGLRWINFLIFSFCYLLVLPTRWTLRAKFEREAYTQTLLVHHEITGKYTPGMAIQLENGLAKIFSGSDYFFMWNETDARAWVINTMMDISEGKITNDKDRIDLEGR